jgi:uncharacterized protein Yka (UPF0111/DUF47 family)
MKRAKPKKITDEMIGEADKICACSAIVGDIIASTNESNEKKASLQDIMKSIKKKEEHVESGSG